MSEGYYDARAVKEQKKNTPLPIKNTVKHFTKWKQEAVEMMLANDTLMKLLYYSVDDWYAQPKLTFSQKLSLINKQIVQHKVIPEIIEEKKSYIGMSMNHFKPQEGFRQFSKNYMQGYFYFNLLVDRDIIITDTGLRTDLILTELYELFQGTKVFGMGQASCQTILDIWADNNSHGGYTIGFMISDMK